MPRKKKNPIGNPTKYKPEYKELAIKTIGDEGKTVVQFARDLRVHKATVYRWAEKHSDFRDALSLAQDFSEAYWMDKMPTWMDDRNSNGKMIGLYMANRFGWRTEGKQDSDQDQKPTPIQINIVSDNGKSE